MTLEGPTSDALSDFYKWLDQNPLVKFSPSTHTQIEALEMSSSEVLKLLDSAIVVESGGCAVHHPPFMRALGMFWLWVLGAYEVTRTMAQRRSCFADPVAERILTFKRRIGRLRIPFAKQEYQGSSQANPHALSVYSIEADERDVVFRIKEDLFPARRLIAEFNELVASIRPGDVIERLG